MNFQSDSPLSLTQRAGAVRYFSLARHALVEALRISGIGQGQRVLLPAFICRDLLASLARVGASAVWYEVGPDLRPLGDPLDWPEAEAVVAVDYFGFAQDLTPFHAYAAARGAWLIEDNAHGYLSRDEEGHWLGLRASLGLFSLRKTLRMPDGAALAVNDPGLASAQPAQLPFDGPGLFPAQLAKARLRGLPLAGEWLYQASLKMVRLQRQLRRGSAIPAPLPEAEQILPCAPAPWKGLPDSLAECVAEREVARRRAAWQECHRQAVAAGITPVFNALPGGCAPYGYAFRGEIGQDNALTLLARQRGFDLMRWPDLPEATVGRAPAHYRNLCLVNFLW